jgi:diguanylate cyclase (GGDEF)-like protein
VPGRGDTTLTDAKRAFPEPSGDGFLVIIHEAVAKRRGSRLALGPDPVRLGRDSDNEIVLDDDTVSRRHARIEKREGGWVVMDVGSRNGTLVNDREISGTESLRSGDRLQIGSTVFKYLAGDDAESDFYEEVYQMMITDSLTQVGNRRQFDDSMEREMSRARRFGRPLSVVMFDIDLFKNLNDEYGHLVGDAVLRDVARVIRTRVRRDDTVVRYGGEEFVVILPETVLGDATVVAMDLNAAIAGHVLEYRGLRLSVTVSVGCAELLASDVGSEDLVRRADQKLYAAKRSGRNRVMA